MARDRRVIIGLGVIGIAVIAAYHGVWNAEFLNFDDPDYVSGNPFVQDGLGWRAIRWALTTFQSSNYHPLTWLSHQLDCTLFGVNPRAHHLVNLLWHLANTMLVYFTIEKLTAAPKRALAVAALFALHPVNVETVAWIAERKSLLAQFFGLLAIYFYGRYALDRKPFWPVTVAMALSLLAKPAFVTLPCLLLLVDVWPLRRALNAGRVGEKLPLLILTLISCAVTLRAQTNAMSLFPELTLPYTLGNTVLNYGIYFRQLFWPTGLAAFYPHPLRHLPWGEVAASAALLAALTGWCLSQREKRPYLLVGWLWFLGTLVPMVGLVQVGHQAHADRYLYLPMLGVAIAVVWRLAEAPRAAGATALAALALIPVTARQLRYWQTSVTLWERSLQRCQSSGYDLFVVRTNLAEAYMQLGRRDDAATQLQHGLETCAGRRCAAPILSLAQLARSRGDIDRALAIFRQGFALAPDEPILQHEAGMMLALAGRMAEALPLLRHASALSPQRGDWHFDLAIALTDTHDVPGSERELKEGERLDPRYIDHASEVAWQLANDPNPSGWAEAFFRARQVCRVTGCSDPQGVIFFAAAHAAVGHFDQAVQIEGKLVEFAQKIGNEALRHESAKRQAIYASGKGLWALSGSLRASRPERVPGSTGP